MSNVPPVRIFREPPHYPVGGSFPLKAVNKILNRGDLVQIGSWESGDKVAKPVTVVVTAPMGSIPAGVGAMCKVKYGDQRGYTYAWLPVPGIMTVVATSVSVEGQLCGTPYRLIVSAQGIVGPAFIPPGTIASGDTLTVNVTCLIRDTSPADDPAMGLLRCNITLSDVPLNVVEGPVWIDTLELNNESSDAVGVVWGEGDGSEIPLVQMGSVIVPANSSIGVDAAMLGAVASGFVVAPVTSLVAASSGSPTISPDAGSITANISGFYLPVY